MATHSLTFTYDRSGEPRHDQDLRIKDTYYRLGVGFVAEGDEGRKEMHGPMVPGPWAYTYGLCSVISNTPTERNPEIVVQNGDHLIVDGFEYVIEVYRREYIRLHAFDRQQYNIESGVDSIESQCNDQGRN